MTGLGMRMEEPDISWLAFNQQIPDESIYTESLGWEKYVGGDGEAGVNGPCCVWGQGSQLGPLGFLFVFDSIWVGRERPPSLLRQVCFGQKSDPATGPGHPASPFSLSRGSMARSSPSSFLPPSFLTRPPPLDPGYSSVCPG